MPYAATPPHRRTVVLSVPTGADVDRVTECCVEGIVRGHIVQCGAQRGAWVGALLVGDQQEPAEPWPADYPTR